MITSRRPTSAPFTASFPRLPHLLQALLCLRHASDMLATYLRHKCDIIYRKHIGNISEACRNHIASTARSQCCPNVVPMLSQCCPNVVPMLSQCCPNVVPMLSQCCPNIVPILSQCCPNIVSLEAHSSEVRHKSSTEPEEGGRGNKKNKNICVYSEKKCTFAI